MTITESAPAALARPVRAPGTLRLGLARGGIEIKQFFRARDAVVFNFALPAVLMVLFATIFKDRIPDAGGVTVSQLYVAAMIAAGLMTTSFSSLAIGIAQERDEGTLRRLRGMPMPRASYFIGKVLLVLVTGVSETVVLLIVGVSFYHLHLPGSALKWFDFAWVFLLGLTACTLTGIAASSVPRNAKSAAPVIQLPFLVLQFISGIYIAVNTIPKGLLAVGAWFPLKWMAQGFRGVFLPDAAKSLEAAHAWEYGRIAMVLGAWCVVGLLLCLTTFRWKTRRDG
ncbi:ABC transporter [Mangrovactinospora gilvigrisea]|uniref:Transport permease protein n=1 Tax=Mangrovactinospora gilvigrisea TaxID=1428644 RepID=A0A1J7BK72_9ACTN|nr:ABC transporter permease [Mangrovactinospora gilvigrisea]OIV39079.1 ABC transporter [Mangrovactinospora gilvigrisea]